MFSCKSHPPRPSLTIVDLITILCDLLRYFAVAMVWLQFLYCYFLLYCLHKFLHSIAKVNRYISSLLFHTCFSAKCLLHVAAVFLKRVLFGITILIHHKYLNFRRRHLQYALFSMTCIAYYYLYLQWAFKSILLSDDVRINPGLETLNFLLLEP